MLRGFGTQRGTIGWGWLLLLFAVLVALLLLLPLPQLSLDRIRARLLDQISEVTGHPCEVGSFAFYLPAKVVARNLYCGDVLIADELAGHVSWWSSLRQARIVVTVRAVDVQADFTRMVPRRADYVAPGEADREWNPPLPGLTVLLQGSRWRMTLPYDEGGTTLVISSLVLSARVNSMGGGEDIGWSLAGADVTWTRREHSVSVDRLQLAGRWKSYQGLFLDTGEMTGPQVSLRLTAVDDRGEVSVRSYMDAAVLAAFSEHIPVIHGQLFVAGRLRGSLLDPEVDVFFRVSEGAWHGLERANLRARFARVGPSLRFSAVHLRHTAFRGTANVEFSLGDRPTLLIAARSVVSLPDRALEVAGVKGLPPILGRTYLNGKVAGPLDPLKLEWEVSAQSEPRMAWLSGASLPPARWRAQGTIGPHEGKFQGRASWLDSVHVTGEADWSDGRQTGHVRAEVEDLARMAPVLSVAGRNLGLRGRAQATLHWQKAGGPTEMELAVGAERIVVWQSTLKELRCTATATNAGPWKIAPCFAADESGGTLRLSGLWDLGDPAQNQLELSANELSVDLLIGVGTLLSGRSLPVSQGKATGRLTYRGRPAGPEISLQAALREFRAYGRPVASLSGSFDLRGRQWQLSSEVSRRKGAATVRLAARGEGPTITEASLSGDPIDLSAVAGSSGRKLKGQLRLEGDWRGSLTAPSGTLKAFFQGVKVADLPLGDGEVTISFQPHEWDVRGEAFASQVEIEGKVFARDDYRFSVAARVVGLDLVSEQSRLQVQVGGTARASGRLAEPSVDEAEVLLTELVLLRDTYRLAATAPVRAWLKKDVFQLEPFELKSGDSRIHIQSTWRRGGELQADIRGASDLILLELLGAPVLAANGPITVDLQIARTVEGVWQTQGVMVLREGFVEIDGIPPASSVQGFARLEGETFRDFMLEAEVGGGKFVLAGSGSLAHGASLSWSLNEVAGVWGEDFEATLSGTGNVQGPWQRLTVAGDVVVSSGLYDRNIALPDLLRWMRERLFAPRRVQQVLRVPVALDLTIHSPGNVFIDNNVAKVELWLDLWVGGTIGEPLVAGRIGVIGGEVTAQGRTFTVTGGTVEFRDPATLNPWLNLLAETRVGSPQGEYQITAQVTGQADRPRVHFSADDPTLALDDIVSLLATGRTRAMAGQGAGFSPAGAALALLPKREAEQRLQRWLGVDRFEVAATQARDTGAVEPRVTIGKELAERLYASASTSVGVQSRQTVQLEYRWSRRVSLLGTWESATAQAAGAFAGDIKFRVEFLRSPFSLMCP